MTSLNAWLERLERLHPSSKIELGLDRVHMVARRLDLKLSALRFVVAGTNGKGSSCAMLESILLRAGYRVGTYTSPHLIHFEERARINGEPAAAQALCEQFDAVEAVRGATELTYFEFTTLAILRLFQQTALDAVILEVGLGGRLDAVNIVDADCAIVTSVDIDHAEWLGKDRESIGWEKAHVFRAGRPAICSDPMPPKRLIEHAEAIGADLWLFGRDFNYAGDRQQWSWVGRGHRRNAMAYPALRGTNQLLNASGVLAALEGVRERLPVSQQAVRQGLAMVELPGRFQVLPGRPSVVLDVAHNPHAAGHLAANLDAMGSFRSTWAVLGMLADKDIDAVVSVLGGRVDHWMLASLPGPRAATAQQLAQRLCAAGIGETKTGARGCAATIETFETPSDAFDQALERAGANDRIVVFGSFLTVADVISHRTAKARQRPADSGQSRSDDRAN